MRLGGRYKLAGNKVEINKGAVIPTVQIDLGGDKMVTTMITNASVHPAQVASVSTSDALPST